MLEIKALGKTYPGSRVRALDDVSFEVRNGEVLGFAGLNGAGKTTALKIIAGALLPGSGTVIVDQHDVVQDKAEASGHIGFVPEYPNYDVNSKATSLMKYFAGFSEKEEYRKQEYLKDLLDRVGIGKFAGRKARVFSQGMKKRLSLAIALIGNPDNLLLDETLSNLDPEGVRFARSLIVEMKKEGKAVLLSSHILGELGNLADRVAILHHGRLVSIIDGSQLRETAKSNILVRIFNPDEKATQILSRFGRVTFENDLYTIEAADERKEVVNEISGTLISNRYVIESISRVSPNLENYFFEVLGGEK